MRCRDYRDERMQKGKEKMVLHGKLNRISQISNNLHSIFVRFITTQQWTLFRLDIVERHRKWQCHRHSLLSRNDCVQMCVYKTIINMCFNIDKNDMKSRIKWQKGNEKKMKTDFSGGFRQKKTQEKKPHRTIVFNDININTNKWTFVLDEVTYK